VVNNAALSGNLKEDLFNAMNASSWPAFKSFVTDHRVFTHQYGAVVGPMAVKSISSCGRLGHGRKLRQKNLRGESMTMSSSNGSNSLSLVSQASIE